MTSVDVFCLNHGIIYNSGFFVDIDDPYPICENALHRYFSFYTRMSNPFYIVWMYPKNNFKLIHKALTEYNQKISEPRPVELLQRFMNEWKFIAQNGFHPEFAFYLPKPPHTMRFDQFNLKRPKKKEELSFDSIIQKITFEKEPVLDRNNLGTQEKEAKERTQACMYLKYLDRELEDEFFSKIVELQSSDILEQRWITLIALRYYLFGKVQNFDLFLKIIRSNLKDDYYIIRQESFDSLFSIFVTQPMDGLRLIREFLHDKDPIITRFALELLTGFNGFINKKTGFSHRWDDIKEKIRLKPKKEVTEEFYKLSVDSENIIHDYIKGIINLGAFWKEDELTKRIMNSNYLEKDKFIHINWKWYRTLRITKEPFHHYYERMKEKKKN